jgi:hypothetical protein
VASGDSGGVLPFGDGAGGECGVVGGAGVQGGDGVAEVAIGVEVLLAAVFDDGADGGGAFAAGGRAEEEPVLATDGPRAQGVFGRIVVDGQEAVVEEAPELGPALACVVDGDAECGCR